MSEETRSQQVCPVCGRHSLALDEPPRIDIMGVQPNSDLLGMGDLRPRSMGIVCLECGSRWRSREALERNEPEPDIPGIEPSSDEDDDGTDAA